MPVLLEGYMWGPIAFWLGLLVLMIVFEITTAQLVSIWFAGGAVVALILAAFNVGVAYQVVAFVLTSALLLLVTKPLVKKFKDNNKIAAVAAESLLGEDGVVTREITQEAYGEIKTRYERYTASIPEGVESINVGEKIKIIEINGNKVVVEKEEN